MSIVRLNGTLLKIKKGDSPRVLQLKFIAPEPKIQELEPYLLGKKGNEPTRFKLKGIHSMYGMGSHTWEGCPYRIRPQKGSPNFDFFFWVDENTPIEAAEAVELFRSSVGYRCDLVCRVKKYRWWDKNTRIPKKGWRLELLKISRTYS
jgi:hypothetical protein